MRLVQELFGVKMSDVKSVWRKRRLVWNTTRSTTSSTSSVSASNTSALDVFQQQQLVQFYSVLQSTTPVLLGSAKYYSSTTPVLLHSTTPVLFCTTKYYSSSTLHYKVPLQYYSVLQSTTPVLQNTSTSPVLLATTRYYSSTTSTTPVLLRTTK